MATATKAHAIALRPYQEEAIEAINHAEMDGITRPLVALPMGTGKTVIFSHLIDQRLGRSLVLAHRDELIRQTVDKLLLVSPDCTVGVVKAEENELFAPVVVGSVQTLSRPSLLEQMAPDFDTFIIDEAHHAPAPSYQRVMEYLGYFGSEGPLTVGCTAIPEGADKMGLDKVWERIVYQKSLIDMIMEGYLCDLRVVRVSLQVNLDQVHTRGGDFVESELESALLDADAPGHVVAAYQEHVVGRKALVFTPTVRVAHEMAQAYRGAGISVQALGGKTPFDERRDILHWLRAGETRVVCNCAVLTEGFGGL